MSADTLKKMYNQLTQKEMAALLLAHSARGDEGEASRVLAAIQRVSMTGAPEVQFWYQIILFFANYWGMEYWRKHVVFATHAAPFRKKKRGRWSEEEKKSLLDSASVLAGLWRGMETFCNEHHIDPQTILTLAQNPGKFDADGCDEAKVAEVAERFLEQMKNGIERVRQTYRSRGWAV